MLYPSKIRLVNANNDRRSKCSWYEATFIDFPCINAAHQDLGMAILMAQVILSNVASSIEELPVPSAPEHGDTMIALDRTNQGGVK